MKIKTETLQDMVAKVAKGASNNKLAPITELMLINLEDGQLTLETTNLTDYLYITQTEVEGDNMYVVVSIDMFSKLISKLTCEEVEIKLTENYLEVHGNGTYQIELQLDEDGNTIKYPDPLSTFDASKLAKHDFALLKARKILSSIKPALALNDTMPCYTNYYVADKVVATDTYVMSGLNGVNLLEDSKLISADTINLLGIYTDESISYVYNEENIIFSSPNIQLYTSFISGVEEFNISAISSLLDQKFESMCKLDKQKLIQILDRISLFVGDYDKNVINLSFSKDGLEIASKASNGVETIDFVASKKAKEYSCKVGIDLLMSQIKAQTSDTIKLWFGNDKTIKIVDDDVVSIIALIS